MLLFHSKMKIRTTDLFVLVGLGFQGFLPVQARQASPSDPGFLGNLVGHQSLKKQQQQKTVKHIS